MEILIAIAVSSLTGITKWVSKKFGKDIATKAISGIVLVLCLVGALLYTREIVTIEMVKSFLKVFFMAVGWYETIYKWILKPTFSNLINKITK